MKFTCNQGELDRQLQFVSRVVTARSTVPILSNLLIETNSKEIRMSGTDLELAVATVVAAQVEEEGSFTVPAKLFQDFIHQNPDQEITFHRQSHKLHCTSSQVTAHIPGIDADEYPALPMVKENYQVTLAAAPFVAALRQVVIACALDPGRPVLTGVYFSLNKEEVILAATDSFRLVERQLPGVPVAKKVELLVPVRTMQELIRVVGQLGSEEDVVISIGEQQAVFRVGGVELYSRLLTGVFPKYQSLIPHTFMAKVTVATAALLQALRLTGVFSQAGTANIVIEVEEKGEVALRSYGARQGEAQQKIPSTTEEGFTPLQAAFNARFLQDAVSATGADEVQLHFSGKLSPLVIYSGDPHYTQIVMPIRLES